MSAIVGAKLRKMGWDVLTTQQAGNSGEPDPAQLEYASREGRILVTRNYADFQDIHHQFLLEGRSHSGIIICFWRPEAQKMVEALIDALRRVSQQKPQNTLTYA
jgi:hypothetical protein